MTDGKQHWAALVVGASGGIGAALQRTLDHDPRTPGVVAISRRRDGFDVLDEDSVRRCAEEARERLDALAPELEGFDLIVNATGVLAEGDGEPEKSFDAIEPTTMTRIMAVNAVGAALVLKHFAPHLAVGRRTTFATLSARVGSIGDNRLGGWMSYRASKAALNQIVRCAALEIDRRRPESVVVALHPGTIETALTRRFARGRYTATADEAARQMLGVLEELMPAESGGFFDYAGKEIPW